MILAFGAVRGKEKPKRNETAIEVREKTRIVVRPKKKKEEENGSHSHLLDLARSKVNNQLSHFSTLIFDIRQ
jgi:hypothetical protein